MSVEMTYRASKEEIIDIVREHLNNQGFSVLDISLEDNEIRASVQKKDSFKKKEEPYDYQKGYEEALKQGRFGPGDW